LFLNISSSAGIDNTDMSGIFDRLGSDYTKLRVTSVSGSQLYTEVEKWDNTNKTAQLWVKATYYSNFDNLITYEKE